MKTLPSLLQAHYDSGATTTAVALKITRTDGQVFGLTSAGVDVTISGTLYTTAAGLEASSIAASAGYAVDNLELATLDDGTLFSRTDVLGGVWNNASFLLFRYNWLSPTDGTDPLLAGTFGNVQLQRGRVVAELRGLQQYLQQQVGNVSSRTCRARFADFPSQAGTNRCGLVAATYTRTSTVSAVASRQVFTSSGLWLIAPYADYFGEGVLTWTSGANAGVQVKVKTYVASGQITLLLPLAADIAVGDAFSVLAGCRKRLNEDCKIKYGNVVNFQGEPHLPGVDALTTSPEVDV